MSLKIQVIISSTRPGRFSEKPAHWILSKLKQQEGIEPELLDLREYPLPFYDEPQSPSQITNFSYSNDMAVAWAKKVGEGDGYVIVTPEYNHGYPGVLKNALDYVYHQWNHKAVGFVSYGGVSGARVIEQLRLVSVELQMVPIRNSIHIPPPLFYDLKGREEVGTEDFSPLDNTAHRFINQLQWWTEATRAARERE
ncbi:NAD(P)H-dependent oxidoreductase [Chitinispirillales bacterium ANBcel5]|uniref:NADPH-dependent FMN reductase n=1 Tax=Cellulosispirillum alkaliphilum TaxID=3039283 RepID=UPI002A4F8D39|nr:NAD(P)H-dependent oxidoreductase [Chitinispirillales bacterium ANBcel5]